MALTFHLYSIQVVLIAIILSLTFHRTSSLSIDRRAFVSASTAAAMGVSAVNNSPANAADASAFVGTYSDPVNHPGGRRTIRLVGEPVGDYQLAEVVGGGGRGEPERYVLPATVLGGRKIFMDFTVPPKSAPSSYQDFVGVLDDKGNINFLKDGNVWPRVVE